MATIFWQLWDHVTPTLDRTRTRSGQSTPAWRQYADQLEPELIQLGDKGDRVRTLQSALQALCLYGGRADGYFGPRTEAALVQLQENLGVDRNGLFDQATWYALSFWTPAMKR